MTEKFWKKHRYLKVIIMFLYYPLYILLELLSYLYKVSIDYYKIMFQDFNPNKEK